MVFLLCSLIAVSPSPGIVEYLPVRQMNHESKTLADILSHVAKEDMESYSNDVTLGHELTHVINNKFGNEYKRKVKNYKLQGLYVLDNNIVMLQEPPTTIAKSRLKIPRSLRGVKTFELYTGQRKQPWWNDYPLYLFNEWVAYTNGSMVRYELGLEKRGESVQYMLELMVYSMCVIQTADSEDEVLKDFVRWYTERTINVYEDNLELGGVDGATGYLKMIRHSQDADGFRHFMRNYLGQEWTKKVLGF